MKFHVLCIAQFYLLIFCEAFLSILMRAIGLVFLHWLSGDNASLIKWVGMCFVLFNFQEKSM